MVVTICAVVAWGCSAAKVHDEGNFINAGATGRPTAGIIFPNRLDRSPNASEVALRFAIWAPVAVALYFGSRYHARRKTLGLWLHYVSVAAALALLLQTSFFRVPIFDASAACAAMLSLYGLVSGFVLMARRKGETESVMLGVSTVAAFVLLLLCGAATFVV